MNTLSYMTIDGGEISNSARLAALYAAGLVPDTIGVSGTACGVLQREAATLGGGSACTLAGFSDTFDETTTLDTTGNYGNTGFFVFVGAGGTSRLGGQPQPLALGTAGISDGFISPLDETNGIGLNGFGIISPGPYPLGASQFRDGFVSLAVQVNGTPVANQTAAAVTSRVQGTPSADPQALFGDTWLQASLLWASATTVNFRLDGMQLNALSNSPVFTAPIVGPFATPTGRFWVGLRTSGTTVTAELWTSNPAAGGQPYQSIAYTLTSAAELAGFNAAGRQGYRLAGSSNQPRPPAIAGVEFVTTPVCTATCTLYPSPFLYPSPAVFPAVCGTPASILASTPWTDSSRPESNDFLGFYIDDIDGLDGDTTRDVQQKPGGLGGASLGTLIQQGRSVKVHGWLMARGCRGLDYGREWLNDVLAARCHPCADSVMRLRTAVPTPDDGTNDSQGLYYLYDAGLVDGPHVTPVGGDCTVAEVNFTVVTGNGYKYQLPFSLLPATTFVSVAGTFTQQVPTPAGLGTNGAIITIKAGSQDLTGVFPAAAQATYPADNLWPSDCLYPNDGGTPVTLPITTCPSGFSIPLIPAGGTLVIDSARHRITYTDASGNTQDGTFLLAQDTARAIDWLEADACNTAGGDLILIGAVSYGPDATVQIDVQHREG